MLGIGFAEATEPVANCKCSEGILQVSFLDGRFIRFSVTVGPYVVSMEQKVLDQLTTDALEQQLIEIESFKARLTAQQLVLLREADHRQTLRAQRHRRAPQI